MPIETVNYKQISKTVKPFVKQTRTTNVVRNAGCARSRYTLNFFFNQLINELINQSTEYI